jgi:hypothetical protein
MGFEVMDVGDSDAAPTPTGPGRPRRPDEPDVVDLETLPPPRPGSGYAGWQPPAPAWLSSPTAVRTRSVVGLLVVLGAGLVTGGAWAGEHQRQQHAAEQQATLAVTALTDSWTRLRWTRRPVVDVVVRLLNAGPLAVDVVPSSFGDRRPSGSPFVRSLASGLRVGPGRELAISVLQRLDCSSSSPISIELPVRTADGVVHRVPVRRGGPERLVPREVCADAAGDLAVSAALAGSVGNPVVEVHNGTSRPIRISLDPTSPVARASGLLPVTVSTAPALPTTVPAYSMSVIRLSVRARDCHADVADLQAAAGTGVLGLIGRTMDDGSDADSDADPDTDSSDSMRLPLEVDLSALLGAALQRDCG